MYENGDGVPKDINIAIEWYEKSANQGYAEAQCNLGYIYKCGNGVTEYMILAAKWYEKAAAQIYAGRNTILVLCMKNDQIYNNYENIYDLCNYEYATLNVKYIGSINISEKIVLKEDINTPYNDIYQHVMIEFDRKRNYSSSSISLDNCCHLLASCVWRRPIVVVNDYHKLDMVKSRYTQFWKQKTDEALKKVDDLVDKNIEKKFLETDRNRNELLAFRDLSIEQQSVSQSRVNIDKDFHFSEQLISQNNCCSPKKVYNKIKFRSSLVNRYSW